VAVTTVAFLAGVSTYEGPNAATTFMVYFIGFYIGATMAAAIFEIFFYVKIRLRTLYLSSLWGAQTSLPACVCPEPINKCACVPSSRQNSASL